MLLRGISAAIFLFATAASHAASGSQAAVDALHAVLIEVMQQAEALGYDGRRERLEPVLDGSYDLPLISRVVLGRAWNTLSSDQQARMRDVFARLTVATYASRFDAYAGERFDSSPPVPMAGDREHVRAVLTMVDGGTVQFDYVLHLVDGGWRIVNVVADGVSDLALKRAEYAALMEREGFDGLIERIEQQISQLAAAGG